MAGTGCCGDLTEKLAPDSRFVRQQNPDFVHAIPLRFAKVAGRPIEEDAILLDRATQSDRRAHLRRQQRVAERPGLHAPRQQIVGQLICADKIFRQPVDTADSRETIRPTAADCVGDGSTRPAEFSTDAGALQVHLGDIELVHLAAQISESGIRDVGTIDQIGVVLAAAAGSGTDRAPVVSDAWNQLEHAAVRMLERKRIERIGLEVEADFRRSHVDDGRCRRDGQLFFDRDPDDEVQLGVPSDFDERGAFGSAGTGLLDLDGVLAGEQVLELVPAVRAGLRRAAGRQAVARDPHSDVGDGLPILVEHDP
jgi:hypothetical protein